MSEPGHPLTAVRRIATVTALPGAQKATVQLGGDTAGDTQDVQILDGYVPQIGDTVAVLAVGGDLLIIGATVPNAPVDQWVGTALKGTYDPTKIVRRLYARATGTADAQGEWGISFPQTAITAILAASVAIVIGATAVDVFPTIRLDVSLLGPSPAAQLAFQHRLYSTGAAAASRQYDVSVVCAYQV